MNDFVCLFDGEKCMYAGGTSNCFTEYCRLSPKYFRNNYNLSEVEEEEAEDI